jgi:hypothetical protein
LEELGALITALKFDGPFICIPAEEKDEPDLLIRFDR